MLGAISNPLSGLGGSGGLSTSSSATSSAKSGDLFDSKASQSSFDPVFGAGARGPTFNLALGDGAKVSSSADINPVDSASKWTLYGLIAAGLLILFIILRKA